VFFKFQFTGESVFKKSRRFIRQSTTQQPDMEPVVPVVYPLQCFLFMGQRYQDAQPVAAYGPFNRPSPQGFIRFDFHHFRNKGEQIFRQIKFQGKGSSEYLEIRRHIGIRTGQYFCFFLS